MLRSAEGAAVPPDGFDGSFDITQSGLNVTVPIIAIDGQVWAQLPLTSVWSEVDPADYGLPDPGTLLDPEQGVSQLLVLDPDPRELGQTRLEDEVLDTFAATLPGDELAGVLPIGDPSGDVAAELAIDPDTDELRILDLLGDFYDQGTPQEYRIVLDSYGEDVAILAPESG